MHLYLSRTCEASLQTARPCWKKDLAVITVWVEDEDFTSPIPINTTPTLIDGSSIIVGVVAVKDYLLFKGA